MPIPVVNQDCCKAVLQKMCHDNEGGPAEFGHKFMTQMTAQQPDLMDALTQAMAGYVIPQYGDNVEEAAEVCGTAIVICGFLWKSIEAAVEAKDLEDIIG